MVRGTGFTPIYKHNPVGKGENIEAIPMERLFVYGIFLSERNRRHYGMVNPEYATVRDYATIGGQIVEAVHVPKYGLALTGLTVDIPTTSWKELDSLEYGYDRERVVTTDGEEVWMYVGKK